MLADYHLHSHFSGDCKVPMKDMIQSSIDLKMDRLCFTEHHDLDFPHPKINFVLDIDAYIPYIQEQKELYKKQLQILIGIELGIQPHLYQELSRVVATYPFDFVLASNHLARGIDPYDKIYFENRSQHKGYLDYFEDMLDNVRNYEDYDIYAHLDYVIRYGDFTNKKLAYNDFKETLDSILKTIIEKGKGIEVNTSGYRYNLGDPHPSFDIIKHYKDLGGELITIGSDAHMEKHLMNHFDDAKALLTKAGFKYFNTFVNRKPEYHPL